MNKKAIVRIKSVMFFNIFTLLIFAPPTDHLFHLRIQKHCVIRIYELRVIHRFVFIQGRVEGVRYIILTTSTGVPDRRSNAHWFPPEVNAVPSGGQRGSSRTCALLNLSVTALEFYNLRTHVFFTSGHTCFASGHTCCALDICIKQRATHPL